MMRKINHWTPTFIINRLAIILFRKKYSCDLPCLAVGAIQFLEDYLSKNDSIFEYGSGFSTAWLAKRVGRVVSVESDEYWYNLVKDKLSMLDNSSLYLINSTENQTHTSHVSWDYVNKIKEYEKDSFDMVLNDGYSRSTVSNLALDYLKPGGMFIWDDYGGTFPVKNSTCPGNSGTRQPNDEAERFLQKVANWRRIIFDDGSQTTAIFFKP